MHLKKYRQAQGLFIAEGDKIVRELLDTTGWHLLHIYALPDWIAQNAIALEHYQHIAIAVSEAELTALSALNTPPSVAAVVQIPPIAPIEIAPQQLYIALDQLNDPGNLGAIIRIADWFGITTVFCSPDSVEVFNPKTIQAAMGSLWRVHVVYTDLKQLFAQHRHTPVYGAVLNGENLFSTRTTDSGFLLIGSESHGIGAELQPYITQTITIPRFGQAESLNAAVAAGIICAHFAHKS